MKKKDLIEALAPFPDDMEVAICDWRKNIAMSHGEYSSGGIYEQFVVEKIEDEQERDPDRISSEDKASAPWIALSFENEELEGMFDDGSRRCRVCGCTDGDCRQCIEKTGRPCNWVEEDLCSACASAPRILLPGADF